MCTTTEVQKLAFRADRALDVTVYYLSYQDSSSDPRVNFLGIIRGTYAVEFLITMDSRYHNRIRLGGVRYAVRSHSTD